MQNARVVKNHCPQTKQVKRFVFFCTEKKGLHLGGSKGKVYKNELAMEMGVHNAF